VAGRPLLEILDQLRQPDLGSNACHFAVTVSGLTTISLNHARQQGLSIRRPLTMSLVARVLTSGGWTNPCADGKTAHRSGVPPDLSPIAQRRRSDLQHQLFIEFFASSVAVHAGSAPRSQTGAAIAALAVRHHPHQPLDQLVLVASRSAGR
jgi:hypothetical protein